MKLNIISVGKPREDFIKKGISSYTKRISRYIPFNLEYLADAGSGLKDPAKVKEKEEKVILKKISPRDYVVLMDEKGSLMTSEAFSSFIFKKLPVVSGKMMFVIGGPYGVSNAVRQRCSEVISLSPMTLTHEMSFLFLTEQIYRAIMIENNTKYHHI